MEVLGQLAANAEFDVSPEQRRAWEEEITILRGATAGLAGTLLLEFTMPRLGRRADAVLLVGPAVFVLEFKIGEDKFDAAARDQVWDYALDLKSFHEASHAAAIMPVLIATDAPDRPLPAIETDEDRVYRPIGVNAVELRGVLDGVLSRLDGAPIEPEVWRDAPYRPTPTIIEAARALYARHSVEAIARCEAGTNLRVTTEVIHGLAAEAWRGGRKAIAFVTGVPGAGKTLVGLNLATQHGGEQDPYHAVFLSGNGPLVAVLRAALLRDELARAQTRGDPARKAKVRKSVESFIQNVHHFRDEAVYSPAPPDEHLVIFDEAQRAWDLRKTADFMKRRKKIPNFSHSESEYLISYMDRHRDWAFIVCLVGGGQEIHSGEAGISAWLEAIARGFPRWDVHMPRRLAESEYAAEQALEELRRRSDIHYHDELHLGVSMRSYRAENVSELVRAVLDCERSGARAAWAEIAVRYPVALTRNLDAAKRWVREHARGTARFGLLASSRAQRLKPHAIDVRVEVDPVHWFLDDKSDTRSSFYLEDAATEFQVQGLELDWACVTWDGDLRFDGTGWRFHDFRGKRWQTIRNEANQRYVRNAYRVLLTRARQGMVIFVPQGSAGDPTRAPEIYDATYRYLADIGLPVLG